MFRFVRLVSHLGPIPRLALFFCGLAVFAAGASDTLNAQTSGVQLAVSPSGGIPGFRAQMAFPPLAPSGGPSAGQCRPPTTLCSATVKALEQGAFLDFRAGQEGERAAAIRLLAPFDVVRIDALDRTRCPAKLCAGHVALEGVLADLMREGYLTHNVVLYPASAMLTLRTERIGRDTKVLKGACRFNLDTKCVDSNTWLQEDQRISGPCGFAQTRVFVAASFTPEFVAAASFAPAGSGPAAGAETLRLSAFDAAAVKIYELLYVHKLCRNEMVLVRNG